MDNQNNLKTGYRGKLSNEDSAGDRKALQKYEG